MELMNWFRESPQDQREEDSIFQQRRQWAATAQRALEEYRWVSPALWAAENQARDELEETKKRATEMIRKATQAFFDRRRERQKADEERDREVEPAYANLRRTASPKIYEYQRVLETRRTNLRPENEWGASVSGGSVVTHSTTESVKAAVDRINRIIVDELQKVELEPLSDAELKLRLQRLEASIPLIEMRKI